MPAKNRTKEYLANAYYHIYNRGVEKRTIFNDQQDYSVFLSYLKEYLAPKNKEELLKNISNPTISYKQKGKMLKFLRLNNFADEITLLAYCLMPNHFHFLIKQKGADTIDKFMNSFGTRYTMYFNRKYKRVGSLYQGVYKAVLVKTDEQLLHLSCYIHQNPLKLNSNNIRQSQDLALQSQPSSYLEYLNLRKTTWIQPNEILSYFSENHPSLSYKSFVNQEDNPRIIQNLLIEDY